VCRVLDIWIWGEKERKGATFILLPAAAVSAAAQPYEKSAE